MVTFRQIWSHWTQAPCPKSLSIGRNDAKENIQRGMRLQPQIKLIQLFHFRLKFKFGADSQKRKKCNIIVHIWIWSLFEELPKNAELKLDFK